MTACQFCQDTGRSPGSDSLDCTRCGAAAERAEFFRWFCANMSPGSPTDDRLWAVFQRGKAAAARVAPVPAGCWFTEELAGMVSAPIGSPITANMQRAAAIGQRIARGEVWDGHDWVPAQATPPGSDPTKV